MLSRHPAAAIEEVEHDPDGDDEADERWRTTANEIDEPTDLEWLAAVLRAVFAGRVWKVAGDTGWNLSSVKALPAQYLAQFHLRTVVDAGIAVVCHTDSAQAVLSHATPPRVSREPC